MIVRFKQKTNICNAKLGNLRTNGDRGKNSSSKVPYGITDPDLPIHYATFIELR